jgi:hypothetical protein
MWVANFEDGSSESSKKAFWTQLSREKRMSGLQLSHPYLPKLWLCLNGYDRYYFTQEAIASPSGTQTINIISEIIGAHDVKLGVGVEIRLARTGNVDVRTYPISIFKYSPEILYDGNSRGEKMIGVANIDENRAESPALS